MDRLIDALSLLLSNPISSPSLYFPTEGCWEVTARAAEHELSFVVWVEQDGKNTSLAGTS
jgi:hypothetical protein